MFLGLRAVLHLLLTFMSCQPPHQEKKPAHFLTARLPNPALAHCALMLKKKFTIAAQQPSSRDHEYHQAEQCGAANIGLSRRNIPMIRRVTCSVDASKRFPPPKLLANNIRETVLAFTPKLSTPSKAKQAPKGDPLPTQPPNHRPLLLVVRCRRAVTLIATLPPLPNCSDA